MIFRRFGQLSSASNEPERSANEMTSNNSNKLVNPNAREAMNRFKMETAAEVGVSTPS